MDCRLCWEPGHGSEIQNKEAVENEVRGVLAECGARLPGRALAVIARGFPGPIEVMLYSDKDRPEGTVSGGAIHLNVPRPSRHESIWVTAHEMAHCYWDVITHWAQSYFDSEVPSRKTYPPTLCPKAQDGKCEEPVLICEGRFEDHARSDVILNECGETVEFRDRLADLIAISWGFEQEYAETLDLALFQYDTQGKSDYFRSQLLTITGIIGRRLMASA